MIIKSKQKILEAFVESNNADCRINAFSFSLFEFGLNWTPNLIFIDLDRNDFKSQGDVEKALEKTLLNIKQHLGSQVQPTVLHTGGGYHIIQPVDCPVALEYVKEFQEFGKPSEQFLRFIKDYLSSNKADKLNYPSFKSCLLRIPWSINSKQNKIVRIVQKWNGYRPGITKDLLTEFRGLLIQKKIDQYNNIRIQESLRYSRNQNYNINNSNYYQWIDKLLKTPLADFRKNATNLITAPYLVNIKKLSYQQSFDILIDWLQKCNSIKNLDFKPDYLVKYALTTAIQKRIPPMKLVTLKDRNLQLYNILHKQNNNS